MTTQNNNLLRLLACLVGVVVCLVAGAGFASYGWSEWMAASFLAAFFLLLAIADTLENDR